MPSFEYTAIDRQGQSVHGQVDAATRDEAALNLTRSGLLVSRLDPRGTTPLPPRNSVAASPPVARPLPAAAPATRGAPPLIRSLGGRRGSDQKLSLLFGQLATMARSGFTPKMMADHLLGTELGPYRDSIAELASGVSEGRSMSEGFARHPDLYPAHVVGTVRAGEQGGFLPDALDAIADWGESSHKFKRIFWFTKTYFIGLPIVGALSMVGVYGSLRSIDAQDRSGGAVGAGSSLLTAVLSLLPRFLAFVAIFLGALLLIRKIWMSPRWEALRHRLAMKAPGISKRVSAESLARFSWVYGRLSEAGISPATAWSLSCDAMPNLEMAAQMRDVGSEMGSNVRASTMLRRHEAIVPPEYADIVEVGEAAGDVPGALMRVSRAAEDDFTNQNGKSQLIMYLYTYGVAFIIVLVVAAVLATAWYGGIQTILLRDEP